MESHVEKDGDEFMTRIRKINFIFLFQVMIEKYHVNVLILLINTCATVTTDASASAHTLGEDVAKTNEDMSTLPDEEDDGNGKMKATKGESMSTMQSSKNKATSNRQKKIGKVEESMSEMASSSTKMLEHMKESGEERKAAHKERNVMLGQLVATLSGMLDVMKSLQKES
ncbi:hypothetical protein L7F22_011090 [Adiantum nelumboides]|nr:hypothetical protein [Adiantum nelumboides]